jgi:ESCRT-II complex subunit VPS22
MAHRRRGVGVNRGGGPTFQKKADELKAVSLQSAMETVEKLEVKLTEFAKKHAKEIQSDPAFRQRFLQMCAPLGVDPLLSKKGFWGQVLGMGDFYYELAVKVAEVCYSSRTRNGGIMSVAEVKSILSSRKTKFQLGGQKTKQYSQEDIKTAINKLTKLGGGFRTVQVGNSTMIISVPTELDNDHMEIMTLAQIYLGSISLDQVNEDKGWDTERSKRALDLLLAQGMVWLDVHQGRTLYWFPSIWKEQGAGPTEEYA